MTTEIKDTKELAETLTYEINYQSFHLIFLNFLGKVMKKNQQLMYGGFFYLKKLIF
jgi:hypothetical protein